MQNGLGVKMIGCVTGMDCDCCCCCGWLSSERLGVGLGIVASFSSCSSRSFTELHSLAEIKWLEAEGEC